MSAPALVPWTDPRSSWMIDGIMLEMTVPRPSPRLCEECGKVLVGRQRVACSKAHGQRVAYWRSKLRGCRG